MKPRWRSRAAGAPVLALLLALLAVPAAAIPRAAPDENGRGQGAGRGDKVGNGVGDGAEDRPDWSVSLSLPTEIINSFGVFSASGERLQEAEPGPYSEIGFGAELEARFAGLGLIRGIWRPGAVLLSGYADDPQRVSDPWADVLLEVGVPVAGPTRALWRLGDISVTAGPRITIPPVRVDYEAQSQLQIDRELYIASNQDLHAWSLGLFADGMWPLLGPAPIREGGVGRRGALGVTAGLRWDRFLPVDYATSGLDAYRLNALRERLEGKAPYERIDYRSRFQIDVTAHTSWALGDLAVEAAAGFGGWSRLPPRVDELRPVAGTGTARLDLQGTLGVRVPLGAHVHIGLSADGVVPLFGRNAPVESIFAVGLDMGIGANSDGFVAPPVKQ